MWSNFAISHSGVPVHSVHSDSTFSLYGTNIPAVDVIVILESRLYSHLKKLLPMRYLCAVVGLCEPSCCSSSSSSTNSINHLLSNMRISPPQSPSTIVKMYTPDVDSMLAFHKVCRRPNCLICTLRHSS